MSRGRVIEILGNAETKRKVSKYDIWGYGKGEVKFYLGRLKSWRMP